MKAILICALSFGNWCCAFAADSFGRAHSFVVDDSTGKFLSGAKVELLLPPDQERPKRSNTVSDGGGYFYIEAPLGKVTRSKNIADILDHSIASIFYGAGQKVDRFINASAFAVRVTKDGYKPFESILRVQSADPQTFQVWLQAIHLAPINADYSSYADRVGRDMKWTFDFSKAVVPLGDFFKYTVSVENMPISGNRVPDAQLDMSDQHSKLIGVREGSKVLYSGQVRAARDGTYPFLITIGSAPALEFSNYRVVSIPKDSEPMPALVSAVDSYNIAMDRSSNLRFRESAGTKIYEAWPQGLRNDLLGYPGFDEAWRLYFQSPDNAKHPNAKFMRMLATFNANGLWEMIRSIAKDLPGEFTETIQSCAELQSNPQSLHGRARLLRIRNLMSGRPAIASAGGAWRDFVLKFPLGEMTEPIDDQGRFYAAYCELLSGRTLRAKSYLERIDLEGPLKSEVLWMRGDMSYQDGLSDAALQYYSQAISASPNSQRVRFSSYLNYGRLLLRKGEFKIAESILATALLGARGDLTDFSAPSSKVYVGGKTYEVYKSQVSATVGYAYPEGHAVRLILYYFDSLENPLADPIGTCLAAQSLAEIGLPELAESMIEKLPDTELIQETRVIIAQPFAPAKARQLALEGMKMNPRNPVFKTITEKAG